MHYALHYFTTYTKLAKKSAIRCVRLFLKFNGCEKGFTGEKIAEKSPLPHPTFFFEMREKILFICLIVTELILKQ